MSIEAVLRIIAEDATASGLDAFNGKVSSATLEIGKMSAAAEGATQKTGALDQTALAVSGSMGLIVDTVKGVAVALTAAAAAAVGAGMALFGITYKAFDAIDSLADMASTIGISAKSLQAFQVAGEGVGLTASDVSMSVRVLSKHILDAASGNDAAAKTFRMLGIEVKDTGGYVKSADIVMGKIADKFKVMSDGSEKTALAVELLGRSGNKLIPAFNEGSASIGNAIKKLEELGTVIDDKAIASANKFEGAWLDLRRVSEAFFLRIGRELMPAFTTLMEGLTTGLREGIKSIPFAKMREELVVLITTLIDGLAPVAKTLAGLTVVVTGAFGYFTIAMTQGVAAADKFNAAFSDVAKTTHSALVNVVIPALEVANAKLKETKGAIGGFVKGMDEFGKKTDSVTAKVEDLGKAIGAIGPQVDEWGNETNRVNDTLSTIIATTRKMGLETDKASQAVSSVGATFDMVRTSVDGTKASVDGVTIGVEGVTIGVSNLVGPTAMVGSAFDAVSASVAGVKAGIEATAGATDHLAATASKAADAIHEMRAAQSVTLGAEQGAAALLATTPGLAGRVAAFGTATSAGIGGAPLPPAVQAALLRQTGREFEAIRVEEGERMRQDRMRVEARAQLGGDVILDGAKVGKWIQTQARNGALRLHETTLTRVT